MKLAFAIATVTSLRQAAVIRADCNFGSNYTIYFNSSDYCSFDVAVGIIRNFRESNTTSSGDTNVTTTTNRNDNAIWKIGDKDSTLQCYSDISGETVTTSYPNGSTFIVETGDFKWKVSVTVADGVPLSSPGLYYFQGGRLEKWNNTRQLPKQRVISLICVNSLVVVVQLQLRLPHLQLRKLLAVDKWLQ